MIFSPFERLVAMRYLRTRRREGFISLISWFSLVGIMLGVAALIIVMAVMNGLREDLLSRVIGFNGHVTVHGVGGPLTAWEEMARKVAEVPGVTSVTPVVEGDVMVSVRGGGGGAVLRGLPEPALDRLLPALDLEPGQVAAGLRLADKLGLTPGELVTLVVPQVGPDGRSLTPRSRGYEVAGTFSIGMQKIDVGYLLAPMAVAQSFLGTGEGVSYLEVMVADVEDVPEIRGRVTAVVGDGVRVQDWQQRNSYLFNALQVERWVTFLLLTLIIVVAAFNIISSLSMLVKEKGGDIAILRTMGATQGQILRTFVLSGASIGVAGTLAGVALGLALALNVSTIRDMLAGFGGGMFANEIAFLSRLPARVVPAEVAGVALLALLLTFAATLLPAWRAARLDPVEALRYE